MQALTQALGKLRAKMTHQEKENGGKGEDILVTLSSLPAYCSAWTCLANVARTLCMPCRLIPVTGAAPTASACVAWLVQSALFLLTHQLQSHVPCWQHLMAIAPDQRYSCAAALNTFIAVCCPISQGSF